MAVKYNLQQQKYDMSGNGKNYYFAKAISTGEVNFKTICEDISDRGTATRGDVMVALDGCIHSTIQALKAGKIVRLGDFGSFQIGLSSIGTKTEKEFNSSQIKKAKIIFRPGADLTDMLSNLTYEKEGAAVAATTTTTGGTTTTGAAGTGA